MNIFSHAHICIVDRRKKRRKSEEYQIEIIKHKRREKKDEIYIHSKMRKNSKK
jgi:hypothetical protein